MEKPLSRWAGVMIAVPADDITSLNKNKRPQSKNSMVLQRRHQPRADLLEYTVVFPVQVFNFLGCYSANMHQTSVAHVIAIAVSNPLKRRSWRYRDGAWKPPKYPKEVAI